VAAVVIETRLINDMKTILSQTEFREVIAHLAVTLQIQPQQLPSDWKSNRSFAREQITDEPPLPA